MIKNVKVYTTPTCPYCKLAKKWLAEHKVQYEEIDVSVDEKARQYITKKSGEVGVPQIEVDGKVIVGFDREALEKVFVGKK
ncbi:MAG: glutaredoxin domain-containing protein [Nanoarchaeota archaeon]